MFFKLLTFIHSIAVTPLLKSPFSVSHLYGRLAAYIEGQGVHQFLRENSAKPLLWVQVSGGERQTDIQTDRLKYRQT